MKKKCIYCTAEFVGRSDKRFCSQSCKNNHNHSQRAATRSAVREIDTYLHRNREILQMLFEGTKETKIEVDRLVLVRAGFRFNYCTGVYVNKEGKMYYYVYDFAWMEFSSQVIMLIKKTMKA